MNGVCAVVSFIILPIGTADAGTRSFSFCDRSATEIEKLGAKSERDKQI